MEAIKTVQMKDIEGKSEEVTRYPRSSTDMQNCAGAGVCQVVRAGY